ncbi:hypothetical protein L9F63_019124, partial [Diploptera punctata]
FFISDIVRLNSQLPITVSKFSLHEDIILEYFFNINLTPMNEHKITLGFFYAKVYLNRKLTMFASLVLLILVGVTFYSYSRLEADVLALRFKLFMFQSCTICR